MAPEPKKKDPRKQLLRPVTALPGANPTNGVRMVPGTMKKNPGVISPGNATAEWAAGTAPRGRPTTNLGQYLLKATPDAPSGFEVLNDQPDLIESVRAKYLKAFQLPPALQPKYLRKPEVMERGATGRATKISQGWKSPRSMH